MKLLITLHDSDIFPPELLSPEPEKYTENSRDRVKGIVFDKDNKLALVGNKGYRLLPGGGVENGENFVQAMIREANEEVGCNIEVEREIGFSDEYRGKRAVHHLIYCFVCNVVGEKGVPQTTQKDEIGLDVMWFTLDDAIQLMEKQIAQVSYVYYNTHFNMRAHLAFLNEYKTRNYILNTIYPCTKYS